jgi:nucleoside permease NupC
MFLRLQQVAAFLGNKMCIVIAVLLCNPNTNCYFYVQVNWRPVIGGFFLQFFFATLILKWDVGYQFFSFLGDEARKFLAYTDVGSRFVFGDKYTDHIFVMMVRSDFLLNARFDILVHRLSSLLTHCTFVTSPHSRFKTVTAARNLIFMD